MAPRDWVEWHKPYDEPSSPLSRRLSIVQDHLRTELDRCPAGIIRLISMCAGQGRDVIGVLAGHPRRNDVEARLVELDQRNVELARGAAAGVDLARIDVVQTDAGTTDAYLGAVPAQIILACGVFGNIPDDEISCTVEALPSLCAPRAAVIWTRHQKSPDLTPTIRAWFQKAGFAEEAFDGAEGTSFGVGVHRLVREPGPIEPRRRLFTFVGYDSLMSSGRQP